MKDKYIIVGNNKNILRQINLAEKRSIKSQNLTSSQSMSKTNHELLQFTTSIIKHSWQLF
jgi:hypothetical protein